MKKSDTIWFLMVVALLAGTSIFSLKLFFQQRTAVDKLDIHIFPYQIGNWQGQDLEVGEYEYKILETENLILRRYENPAGESLILFIIYSETNRAVFHPPEVCFLGSGIKIADKTRVWIESADYKFAVNKMYAEKDNYRDPVLYCYKAGNLYTDNFYLQQACFALNQLWGRHKGGATIRVSMPLGQDEKQTLGILSNFLVEAVKVIDRGLVVDKQAF